MVLTVMSVMQGFLDNVKLRARGLLGDVIVDNRAYSGFPLYEEFIEEIRQWPEVVAATPVIYSYGLIRFPDTEQSGTVRVVGLRLEEAYEVNAFRSSLYYEEQYPGATQLGDVRQPRIGVKWEELPEQGGWKPIPSLPEPYATALQQARARGVVDEDEDPDKASNPHDIDIPPGRFAAVPFEGPRDTEPDYVGEPRPGLIIGRDIVAERLSDGRYERFYDCGERVHVTLLQVLPNGTVDQPVKQAFRYVDDSRTGIFEIDSRHVYCDFDLLQKLLLMDAAERADGSGTAPARCSQVQIKLVPNLTGTQHKSIARRLEQCYLALASEPRFDLDFWEQRLVSRITAVTWEESQAHIIEPVEKERILVTIILGVISCVSGVLVLCILYMIVLQKTRDIGIVKAIGGSSMGVALTFVGYGTAIGIVGSVVGGVGGFCFVTYINEFQAFLVSLNPAWQVWDRSVYSFDEIPNQVSPWDIGTVVVAAVGLSILGSLLAAWRAGSMEPVKALSYE